VESVRQSPQNASGRAILRVAESGVATRLAGRQQAGSVEVDTAVYGVFVACLVGGFAATLLFALLGGLGGHGAGHLHAGHGHAGHLPSPGASHAQAAHAHGADGHTAHNGAHDAGTGHAAPSARLAGAASWTLSWLSPLTLAAAVLWFGGVGLIAEGLLPSSLLIIAVVIAVVAALLGAAIVRAAMAAFVRSSSSPLRADATGALGALSAPIRSDAAGEVIYTLEGLRRSAAARSLDGAPLPRGAHVVIVRRERGVAWVTPLDPLAALGDPLLTAPTDQVPGAQWRGDLPPPP